MRVFVFSQRIIAHFLFIHLAALVKQTYFFTFEPFTVVYLLGQR